MIKENCQMNNYGKFGKKLLLQNNVPFSLTCILVLKQGKLYPGVEIFVLFFQPRGWSFALKSCPGAGILMEKTIGQGVTVQGDGNWSN